MTTSKTISFKLLLPTGDCITNKTVIRRNGQAITIDTPLALCDLIKANFLKWSNSKSFTAWANELNESGEYEGTFTKFDALDNLASNYTLNIDGEHVNLYNYFREHKPMK